MTDNIVTRATTPLNDTDISWTDYTWNPIHGCSKVSEGCRNCYAERVSRRYGHTPEPWTHEHAAENVRVREDALTDPYEHIRHDPFSSVFAPSMSDLFHEQVSDDTVRNILAVMANTPTVTYQVLTKRPERAAEWPWFPPNVWVGTSVESRDYIDRIDALRRVAAPVRFVSFEPLLAPVGEVYLEGIDWVIVGGESHPDPEERREMKHEWAVEILEQANADDIPMWFKQSSGAKSETGTLLTDGRGGFAVQREIREKPDETVATERSKGLLLIDQLDGGETA